MSAPAEDWLAGATIVGQEPATIGRPPKDHSGRQRKLQCTLCGFIAYASAGALRKAGAPTCGCGSPLELPNLRDRAVVDWESFERELAQMGGRDREAALREVGLDPRGASYYASGELQRAAYVRRTGTRALRMHRCQGAGCRKLTNGRDYCDECETRERVR